MLPLIAGALIGAGLGYLGYRESKRAYNEAKGYFENLRLPGTMLWEDIQKLGIRGAIEKYGYSQIRDLLDTAYRMQVSSILQRQGRALALSGISQGSRAQALAQRLRTPLDIAYLQNVLNLPFDFLTQLGNLANMVGSQELSRAEALANIAMQRPSLAQDLLAGLQAGAMVGGAVYQAIQPKTFAGGGYYIHPYTGELVKQPRRVKLQ